MAEKIARIHSNQSNRARLQLAPDRKVVYKGVLDSPFRINWPSVPLNIQNILLARVVSLLDGVADYQHESRVVKRKRKRAENSSRPRKQEKLEASGLEMETHARPPTGAETAAEPTEEAPPVLRHITVGINEVTKELEALVKLHRENITEKAPSTVHPLDVSSARIILVCREDVDPPVLIGHIPHLVAACNSTRHRLTGGSPIWLVPLAKGSESSLAAAIGLRRAAVIAIKSGTPGFSKLAALLESTPILSASWLETSTVPQPRKSPLIPTHIKQLRTTAPKDMKAAKERRSQAKALIKERRKTTGGAKSARIPKRITLTG